MFGVDAVDTCGDVGHEFLHGTWCLVSMLLISVVMLVMIFSWYLLVGVDAVDTCGNVGQEFLLGTWCLVSMLLIRVVILVMNFFMVLGVWCRCC